jgi:transposase
MNINIKQSGLDLAKMVYQFHGVDSKAQPRLKRRLSRGQMHEFFRKLPPCLIGIEACGGAHYWARELQKFGHTVKIMAPQFVKPYIKNQKNDANDAEGICEAVGRPNMRFVAIKTVEQQDMQSLHRVRSRLVRERTALGNQIRGLLAEYGLIVPKRLPCLRKALPRFLDDAGNGLTADFRALLEDLRGELEQLEERVAKQTDRIECLAKKDRRAQKLMTIPGIGVLTATALASELGDGSAFAKGRDVAAYLGLTPRQSSSGGKQRLLGISKHGDRYLRTLLIHGARAALNAAVRKEKQDPRSRWATEISGRRHKNIAAVAVANKNARIAWALLSREGNESYDPEYGLKHPRKGKTGFDNRKSSPEICHA